MARKIGKYFSTPYIFLITQAFQKECSCMPLVKCKCDVFAAFNNQGGFLYVNQCPFEISRKEH